MLYAVVVILCALFMADVAAAANYRLLPTVTVAGGYDDNINFNYDEMVADFYSSFKPRLVAEYGSPTLGVDLDASVEAVRYAEEKDLDVENYRLVAGLGYQSSPRFFLSGKVTYIKDTTLDSELEETGRVIDRDERERYQGDAGLTYRIDQLSSIALNYSYIQTFYQSEEYVGRVVNRIAVPYSRSFNNRLDRLSLSPRYSRAQTEDDVVYDYYNLTAGWWHRFSDTLVMNNYLGYGYTLTRDDSGETRNNAGNADLSLIKSGEITQFTVGYRSNLSLDSEGDLREVDRLYFQYRRLMTERLQFLFSASTYASRPVDVFDQVDSWYYDLRPELSYRMTKYHFFSIYYRFSSDEDRTGPNNDYRTRNIVAFRFDFNFPIQK